MTTGIPEKGQRERDQEYVVLAREVAKRQRHLPVRQLAERMPTALRRLTPCLMMSPLSVAQYLPVNAGQFDLVIFDEASQIPTWDAVGAMGRGRQAIVVGDPKQLPPTRFFERQIPGADGAADGVQVDVEDLESILDECIGAGIPAIELRWHYRSRHESLIAFSNKQYYGGNLVTFPSPVTEDRAVSFRHVANGVYARAGGRTNIEEAKAVVAEAVRLLRGALSGAGRRSVGIVTFNAQQQTLIENLLDEARRQDPALEPFFSDEASEPVLVKNLESVQGEERDVMIFSLTYGPDQAGRVTMNFGPLNQSGGERRLNVAITRAREALIVFSSLRAEHIDLSRTSATGVDHLKQFLDFAVYGASAFARATTGPLGDYESPFEAAVAERLAAKGWTLHPQIGVSGFRIDLGVVDPDAPGAFLAGIECDGATYHSGATARDRDRLRQLVLTRLGWRILRVWSTDWWTNAAREADRLHAHLEAALADERAKRAAVQAEQPVAEADEAPQESDSADTAIQPDEPPAPAVDRADEVEEVEPCGSGGTYRGVVSANVAPIAIPAQPSLFDDGVEPPVADGEQFYDDDYRETLRAIVLAEIVRTAPVRLDRLTHRVARAHGFLRAGQEIQDRVAGAIPEDCRRTKEVTGTFVWSVGIDPATCDRFRRPAAQKSVEPGDVPIEELAVLARECLDRFGDSEAAIMAMRDACGMSRLREGTRDRFTAALARSKPSWRPPG